MPPEDQPPSPWTPALITAIASGLVALLAALTTMFVTLQGVRNDAKKAAEESVAQQQVITQKVNETAVKVDGQMSGLRKDLEVSNSKVDGLEKVVRANAADKKVADDLAAKDSK